MIRSRLLRIPRVSLARPATRRSLHSLPALPHEFKSGVPGLLSADGYDMAWTQYQSLMLEKLNSLVAGELHRCSQAHNPLLSALD